MSVELSANPPASHPVIFNDRPADGGPGITPRWTRSDKHGIGTSHSCDSKVWFTVSKGILNEIYYPTIDRPQIRDLQLLITDGKTFFQGERQLDNDHECLSRETLGYQITNVDPLGRFSIEKEVITAPRDNCVLIQTRLVGEASFLKTLRLFAMVAPHLEVGGFGNNGNVVLHKGHKILTAHKSGTWMAMAATIPFAKVSCGYAGSNDGWHDLSNHKEMTYEFDCAIDGNIALTGELDLSQGHDFVLGLAFGETLDSALATLENSLATPFEEQRSSFNSLWYEACAALPPAKEKMTGDDGKLYAFSRNIIRAHEDKTYEGAIIASLSIPWGAHRSDNDLGGYHLVWTRDMCHSATGLLAAGITHAPLRALIYLTRSQKPDGGFYQNFWVNGEPNWRGIQLDETAFPVMLAWQLHQANGLGEFDPYPMVLKAASFLIENGPVTQQERWEENSGFSPSTLAAQISALICAAQFARLNNHERTAKYFEENADFLESHLEQWTVTTQGTLVEGITQHYIRIHPALTTDPSPNENANECLLDLRNQAPDAQYQVPAKDIVDAGFLELVRYGIRKADDPIIVNSVKVVDAMLKVETPAGPSFIRYNKDGYGQRTDGSAFDQWGFGHAWPVLTGERGHYELAAGRDGGSYILTMEKLADKTLLIPEQVWSLPDCPEHHMVFGRATGGAMPLAWAHAEYLQLVRSVTDGKVFSLIDVVAERYQNDLGHKTLEIWKFNRQVRSIQPGKTLRVQAPTPFKLRWTDDNWNHANDLISVSVITGHSFIDIPFQVKAAKDGLTTIEFTFFWTDANRWEERNFSVDIAANQAEET